MHRFFRGISAYFTPTETVSPKVNNFNIIRFIAAFMVIYGHMGAIMGQPRLQILGQVVSTIGVRIFFIISGYLITKSYLSDSHFGRYMIRRSFRIFPALIVAVLLSVFVLGPIMTTFSVSEYFANPGTWQYFKNLILCPVYVLPGVFSTNTYPHAVNGSIWTLPIEFAMYLILPLLVLLFRKLGSIKWGMAVCAVAALVASVCYGMSGESWRYVIHGSDIFQSLPLLPYFFLGSVFSFPEMKKCFNLQLASVLIILAAFVSMERGLGEVVQFIALPYFILSLALTEKPIFSKWFQKSDFSYGLYLYGFPVQQLLWALMSKSGFGVLTMTVISFVSTLILAILSWYFVEKPMQTVAKKLLAKCGKKKTA